MQTTHTPQPLSHPLPHSSFGLNALSLLSHHKTKLLAVWAGGTLLGYAFSFTMPVIYTAKARVLPPQTQQTGLASMLSQLPMGMMGGFSGKDQTQLYMSLFKTNTLKNAVIEKFKLQAHYQQKSLSDTREILSTRVLLSTGIKDPLITIDVDDTDPAIAAAIANHYPEELNKLLQSVAISEAALRRQFFETQLQQSKQLLAQAETRFKELQEQSGVLRLEDQGRAVIDAISTLKAHITSKNIEMEALKIMATDSHFQVKKLQAELHALESQLAQLQKSSDASANDPLNLKIDKLPSKGMEYMRRYRDLKYHETMYELLVKQYEIARLDEARNSQTVQLIDPAFAPEKPSRPKRKLIALLWGFAALSAMLLYIYLRSQNLLFFAQPRHENK